ncbi:MAG TPA: phenylalanine--tRNA ligase subunit alpha [Bacillota bacterium]|jgi:phenylalanyl-tRNA synthetase alpha chain|nr:phenylalanine--tRNA ligase subunit alpha [Fastidiosipila sp.]HPX92670.1 phenylalanine--tRNA ligase subunit alpha [Bacillota bacterium]HQB81037.1 phenylalanine--tRNA ligase subunit alpha [Bacillota bacterium]
MRDRINAIKEEGIAALGKAASFEELESLRQDYLGKKGYLTEVLKGLGKLPPEDRKEVGQLANRVKDLFARTIEQQKQRLLEDASFLEPAPDLTVPGLRVASGGLHPVTRMCYDLNDSFRSLNFEIYSEDEISSELYAFDNLNFPPDHPARDSMDTYWIAGTEDKRGADRLCLRPHLTGGSVRYLQKHGAPARFVYPGRVFRNEATDARHERTFYQYEALIVDRDFSFASGLVLVETILERVFGHDVPVRMRAGFFPFVEPGFEIDMQCQVCMGKGCPVCHHTGWIEVMPGGSPHPNVLRVAGLDPDIWSGFYINIGLDRLVMMRYGIDDVRLFHSADLRFLSQFK